jgi:hypothetical protein
MQMGTASALPTTGKRENFESSYNNGRLDQWGKSVEENETMSSASIFGGTSIY